MRTRFLLPVSGCLVAFLAAPAIARAQDPSEQVSMAKFHIGPLGFSPTLTMGNLGIDTNVFNTATSPTRDFTVTFTPATTEVMHVGRLLLSGATSVPLTYFATASTQRSVGFQQTGRVDLNLIHFAPYVTVAHGSTYERPDPEIDARVQQVSASASVGSIVRISPRTSFDANYTWGSFEFPNADVLGVDIGQQLSRRTSTINANFRTALTPLTTLVVTGALEKDRFDANPLLNSNSLSLVPGFEFKPDARLSGSLAIGVRALRPINPLVPQFTGIVAKTQLSWLLRETTRLSGTFGRDVNYALSDQTPYFVLTGASVSVTQLVVGHVDAQVGLSRAYLAYRGQVLGATLPDLSRRDRTDTYTVGSGYRFRIDARLGFNVSYADRLSAIDGHHYSGFTFGGTMSYGF